LAGKPAEGQVNGRLPENEGILTHNANGAEVVFNEAMAHVEKRRKFTQKNSVQTQSDPLD
jgi:hypothetical protein